MKRPFEMITLIVVASFVLFTAEVSADYIGPYTYEDTQTFDSNSPYSEFAEWWHSIPADFNPVSATIDLTLYVINFSQRATLDLFSSNTDTFDYGGVYSAPSKPGYVGNLYGVAAYRQWDTVSFSLTDDQLDWLADDGQIHMALIGTGYYFTDYPAQFYLEFATLTANAVPIPGAMWLIGFGIAALVGIRKRKSIR